MQQEDRLRLWVLAFACKEALGKPENKDEEIGKQQQMAARGITHIFPGGLSPSEKRFLQPFRS